VAIRLFVLTACLAATNIAPALLLAHRGEIRTVGPSVLLLREDPEYGLGAASALAVTALSINVLAIFLCSPAIGSMSRTGPGIPTNGAPRRR
jgi:hypothetical protein